MRPVVFALFGGEAKNLQRWIECPREISVRSRGEPSLRGERAPVHASIFFLLRKSRWAESPWGGSTTH